MGSTHQSKFMAAVLGTFVWGATASAFDLPLENATKWLSINISPDGAKLGTVIASPSRNFPDYYYHWVRDAGLVMSTWQDVRNSSQVSDAVRSRVDRNLSDYWQITLHHQTRDLPAGLGEVKFHADGEVFRGPWGRPQNDGPAIRALSLMKWRDLLVAIKSPLAFDPLLYSNNMPAQSAIKRDLEYTSHRWNETDFDVWEEVKGHHFFTRLFQMYSLRKGAALAAESGDAGAAEWYGLNAERLRGALQDHWDEGRGFINATLHRDGGLDYKSGLDSAVIIAVLETAQYAKAGDSEWTVLDPRVQATAGQLESAFTKIYAINTRVDQSRGPLIGRYPEDTYDGVHTGSRGNPWFLNTHYMAEYYYQLATALEQRGELRVTPTSRLFWTPYLGSEQEYVTRDRHTAAWKTLISSLVAHGDSIMNHAAQYVGPFGNMGEQIHRDSGAQVGARDLSWSYSSFIRASVARTAFVAATPPQKK